jgi:hypothetical protein
LYVFFGLSNSIFCFFKARQHLFAGSNLFPVGWSQSQHYWGASRRPNEEAEVEGWTVSNSQRFMLFQTLVTGCHSSWFQVDKDDQKQNNWHWAVLPKVARKSDPPLDPLRSTPVHSNYCTKIRHLDLQPARGIKSSSSSWMQQYPRLYKEYFALHPD